MQLSSIEWLASKLSVTFNTMYAEEIKQAKEMHKQEIIDFAKKCSTESAPNKYYEEIYNEIFISKGSDFKKFSLYEHKDTITSADTQVSKTFLESVPQQETLYTEEQLREAMTEILLYSSELTEYPTEEECENRIKSIIQSLKQPKKD